MWYDDDDKHEIKEMIIIKKWYPKKSGGFRLTIALRHQMRGSKNGRKWNPEPQQ